MGYLSVAERFLAARFPAAEVAVLAGSTARGTRTPTSDIDLLLLGDRLFGVGPEFCLSVRCPTGHGPPAG